MIDCHTHVGEADLHLGGEFIADARRVWGPDLQIGTTLERHWHEVQAVSHAVVLAFAAPAVGFVVPNDYVAAYVSEHREKLIGFASVDPRDADAPAELRHAIKNLGLEGLKLGPIYQHVGHMVNPVLVELPADRRSLDDAPEGCLSVPGPHHELARPDRAVVSGVTMEGEPITVEGTGYFARCLQHEFDHLEGRLYIDRLSKRQRKSVLAEMEEMQAAKTKADAAG